MEIHKVGNCHISLVHPFFTEKDCWSLAKSVTLHESCAHMYSLEEGPLTASGSTQTPVLNGGMGLLSVRVGGSWWGLYMGICD